MVYFECKSVELLEYLVIGELDHKLHKTGAEVKHDVILALVDDVTGGSGQVDHPLVGVSLEIQQTARCMW